MTEAATFHGEALRSFLGSSASRITLDLLDSIDSTNLRGKLLGRSGAPAFTAVLADCQTAGRGRLERNFYSPAGGGLYLSLLLRPTLPPADLQLLTPLAAVITARALEELFPSISLNIKWVNDLYLHGKKLCGILTESCFAGEGAPYAVVGIGVNLTEESFPSTLQAICTSLAKEGYGKDLPFLREKLAAAILKQFLSFETSLRRKDFLTPYRERLYLPDEAVSVFDAAGEFRFSAKILGITDDFSLQVRDSAGKEHCLRAGEVSIKPAAPSPAP